MPTHAHRKALVLEMNRRVSQAARKIRRRTASTIGRMPREYRPRSKGSQMPVPQLLNRSNKMWMTTPAKARRYDDFQRTDRLNKATIPSAAIAMTGANRNEWLKARCLVRYASSSMKEVKDSMSGISAPRTAEESYPIRSFRLKSLVSVAEYRA